MGTNERREREKEELRRRILDAARTLFATQGYEHVTMRGIAEAIEYSPTAIYYHFKDKEAVVQCLCQEDFTRLQSYLSTGGKPQDPIARLRQIGLSYARFGIEHPNHYRFMFMTPPPKTPPVPAAPGEESAGLKAFNILRDAVAEAGREGLLIEGSTDAMAQVLWATVHGAVALLITLEPEMFPCVPAAPDLVELTVENSVRGLLNDRGLAVLRASAERAAARRRTEGADRNASAARNAGAARGAASKPAAPRPAVERSTHVKRSAGKATGSRRPAGKGKR